MKVYILYNKYENGFIIQKVYSKIGLAKTLITRISKGMYPYLKDSKWTECEVDFNKPQYELELSTHLTKRALERS